ncbi:MAG: hypothetical protein KAV82_16910, partial [Phycisphaerae bacterium]|nr:hypothetical protein [Phycisphaerae bacterium]
AVLLPPVAVPGGPYSFAAATSQITLDAMGSTDPDGDNGDFSDIASVQWDLGNDGIADDVGRVNALQPLDRADALAKGLAIGSPIDLGLTVVDHDNLTDHEVTQIVYENTSPTVDAGGPYESIASGETVVLDGSVDDADLAVEVGFDELTVEWDVVPATDAAEIGDGFANAANTEVSFETLLARLGGLGVHTIYLNVCDAAGAVASASAQITLSPPDLELTGCSGPAEIAAGDSIEVSWTVTNLGPSEAPGSWVDRVYLSDDAVVGEDIELGEFAHSGPLAGGALYDLTETVVIPGGLSGPHWITVVTDAGATVDELGAEANNGDVCGGVMVYQPPAITAHPVGAMVCSGDSHQMCVSVTGTEPLTYQWHLSGVNIESAESDCYTATETGKYSCTVTNFADSVTSDEATVTIVDPADDCNSNCIDDACDVACGFAGEFCDVVGCGQSEDCNGSNVPDECELMDNDCNTNGIPDECELEGNDCNANSIPDDCELEGNDCNVNGTPDECELAGNDCNNNSIPDDCELEGNDCNGNGVPDECELEGNDCNGNSIPDDCELEGNDCNGNSVPDECELEGNDCNANGIPDDCELAGNDCNANGTPDDCEMGAPVSHNCCETGHGAGCNDPTIEACVCEGDEYCCTGEWDSDCVEEVELFECGSCIVENDCNGNGTLDECDIAGSTSTDCNANAVPDDCDIAGGTSVDCNENSMPDACDIAGGTSNDCDGNSIPDDCEVSAVVGIRISQESSPGADDFADNVLGFIEPYETT